MVDLLERLEVLLESEGESYRTINYLSPSHQQSLHRQYQCDPSSFDLKSAFTPNSSSNTSDSGINEIWREKICEWSYQVIDHFDFSREVVGISIHYLDRFLATYPVNKKLFQLVAMTSLYLAIKIYETGNISMKSMIDLSRGYFSTAQMAEMEMSILTTLSWKLHPPTAFCFCKHILFLLPQTVVPRETRYEILELARFLTELSVIDYFFVVHKSSDVALAALLNSIEAVASSSPTVLASLEQELERIQGGLNPHSLEVQDCRARLQVLYTQGGYSRPEVVGGESRDETVSPVCVSFGVMQQQQVYHRVSTSSHATSIQAHDMETDESDNLSRVKIHAVGSHDISKNTSRAQAIQDHQQQPIPLDGIDHFAVQRDDVFGED